MDPIITGLQILLEEPLITAPCMGCLDVAHVVFFGTLGHPKSLGQVPGVLRGLDGVECWVQSTVDSDHQGFIPCHVSM